MRLAAYFVTTFAVTWSCWYFARGNAAVFLLGVFAPGLVALAFAGRAAALAILRRLIQWDAGVRWYIFAIGYMFTIKLAVAVLHRLITGGWPRFGDQSIAIMFAATIVSTVTGGQAGEEIGWRGFALPRLAEHLGWGGASILLGVIWACWHLPLFLLSGFDTTGQSFPLYLLQVTAVSVALAWLYARTGGSLLLTMLMHAATNNTKDIVPSAVPGAHDAFALSTSLVGWLTVALLWIGALIFLRTMPSARSSAAAPDAGRRGA